MKKIAIATAKGGVGKTTTAVNLGAGLASHGKKILVVDCDPQGNIGGHFNIASEHTLSELLTEGYRDCIIEVRSNMDIITSGRDKLYKAQRELGRESWGVKRFNERMQFIEKWGYDFVFCDFSPTVTFINESALVFCDYILVPVNPSIDAIMGAQRYVDLARKTAVEVGKTIELLGVLINLYDPTVIARDMDQLVRKEWEGGVFKTRIRKNVSIVEARVQNQTIFEYAPQSHGAEDFTSLTAEVLNDKEKF